MVASLAALLFIFILLHLLFPLKVNIKYSTIITDKEGTVIHAFLTHDDKWRMMTELGEITPELKKAIIFKEDKYFYYHFGCNPISIARAAYNNIVRGMRTSGASTITMQVARLLKPKSRTYWNKMKEIFRSFQLEYHYSKDEILQLYLNLIPYGGNIEGVKSAAILYLKKAPNHLSLGELTALAIIPNRPTSLKLGKKNALITQERNRWLERFREAQLFNGQTIDDAIGEAFDPSRHEGPKLAPHFSYRMKNKYPYSPIIKTNLNLATQKKVEKLVSNYINHLRSKNIRNGAVLILNNRTQLIEAYVGSADFNDPEDGGQVDGVRAIRSPGSTLKPLLYAFAFDRGLITPKMMISDVPINLAGYAPENYDQKYYGNVRIEFALANSLNIPAVKLLDLLGVRSFIVKLKEAHFAQIEKDENKLGLSLILGGCGVTLEELTNYYRGLANNGTFRNIQWLQSESDDTTNIEINLMSPAAAYMVTEILIQHTRPDLPVLWQSSFHLPKVAWKTGTSYGRRDAWSIGYNKTYTIGVWVGNFSAEGVPNLSGAEIATPLLFNIFNTVDYNSPNEWYDVPEEVDFRFVCPESGEIPAYFCNDPIIDTYIPGTSPNKECAHLQQVYVSPDSLTSYCTTCLPEGGYKKKYYDNYKPDIIAYYEEQRINYERVPQHNPDCERVFSENEPQIISPVANLEYLIDKSDTQQIKLVCNAANDVQLVYWYINDRFHSSVEATSYSFFTPESGRNKISCTDDKGRNTNIWVTVKYVRL